MKSLLADLSQKMRADDLAREAFTARYGHIRRPMGVQLDGKFWMAHDGVIYQQIQEGPYNFVNALHDHALHYFGEDFLNAQDDKPLDLRHPAIQWMHRYMDATAVFGNAHQDGNGAAWFRLAYDLYTIRDNATLCDEIRQRLLSPVTFQAARYELKVAAICSAAGFDLEFEDESDNRRRHPEFVGTDRLTGARIAVEAKSRHRKGVLGFSGGVDHPPGYRVDVRKNVLDAYRKQAGLPFYIFIDTNLPPADSATLSTWEQELHQLLSDLEDEGYCSPCPANAILFTNDPSHYVGSDPIGSYEDHLWVRCFESPDPVVPHPSEGVSKRLLVAHKQRVAPPTEFYESF